MVNLVFPSGLLRRFNYYSLPVVWNSRYHAGSWDILFFGTDVFALRSLECLNNHKLNSRLINHLEVVCPPERRRLKDIRKHAGITTVRQFAEVNNLRIHDWPLDPKIGAINFHPSLLPKWRGPAPMVHTLLNDDTETGVSVIEVSPKQFDAGPILLQQKVQIPENRTHEELEDQLSELSSNLLTKVLTNFTECKNSARPQNEQNVTTAPKITKELGYIEWSQFSRSDMQRLWCAIGQRVGLRCKWNDSVVKMGTFVDTKGSLADAPDTAEAGQPFFDSSRNVLYVKCKDGWVGWRSLQMEYRQAITAREFYNGYLIDKITGKLTSNIFHDLTG